MNKILAALVLMAAFASITLAHGGKSHHLMGTVQGIQDDHLTITTTGGKDASVHLTADTKYEKDKKPTDRSALAKGARVSIQLAEDDETAVKIKIGGAGVEHQH